MPTRPHPGIHRGYGEAFSSHFGRNAHLAANFLKSTGCHFLAKAVSITQIAYFPPKRKVRLTLPRQFGMTAYLIAGEIGRRRQKVA
jgi:hypothetical protein